MTASIQKYLNQFFSTFPPTSGQHVQYFPVGGGSINDSFRIQVNSKSNFFLKVNSSTRYPELFKKEKTGLKFLDKQKIFKVPAVLAWDEKDGYQLLLLEWIEGGVKTDRFWKLFGQSLAQLHRITDEMFGFSEDNYVGALPQPNHRTGRWIDFFTGYRLEPQITLAGKKGLLQSKHLAAFELLYPRLNTIINEEKPSLLHGDLWSGNYMCTEDSEPALIDPAVYFGNRNSDLAMTTLFGGFEKAFYESYQYHFPLPANHTDQWDICNLYPLLVHLNLFGRGYLSQIETTLRKFA